jgi:hypothetical protein
MTAQIEIIIQFATLATLLAGVIFGILEIRRARKARAEKAAIDVFSLCIQDVFTDAQMLVLDLPLDASPDHIRDSPNLRRAAELTVNQYEYLGMMVFYRIVPLRTLDLLVGGVVRGNWLRLHKYIESEREALRIPAYGEWFQWLAERLEQHAQPEKQVGAHIAFSAWEP